MHRLMRTFSWTMLAFTGLAAPLSASAVDAKAVMQCVEEKQQQRWDGVNSYAVVKTLMGNQIVEYYERVNVRDQKGQVHTLFRRATPDDYQSITMDGQTISLEQFYDEYASGLELGGNAMGTEIEGGMEQAGLPKGMLSATGSDPWATFDPRVMFGGGASMMRSMAEHKRQQRLNPENPAANIDQMADFVDTARVVGEEKVAGRRAYHLRADDINQVQQADGNTFETKTAHFWVDKDWCVPLKMRVEGIATSAGQTRPYTLETTSVDYRQVPDSNMFESYKQTISMGGVMDAAQEAEMEKAKVEIAKMDQQLASMPANERALMERMMGPQLKAMRSLVANGGFQMEILIDEITVNGAPPNLSPGLAGTPFGLPGGSAAGVPTLSTASASAVTTAPNATLQNAQQACLEQKIAEAQAAQKKKRGFGRLLGAVSRTASRLGGSGVAQDISSASRSIYDANATANDLSIAAEELGISQDAVEACRNP